MKKLMGAVIPAVLNPNIRSYTPKNTGQKPRIASYRELCEYTKGAFFHHALGQFFNMGANNEY